MASKQIDYEKRIKFLSIILSISLAFNIGLLINFSFIAIRQDSHIVEALPVPVVKTLAPSLERSIDFFLNKSMTELMLDLKDISYLEEGYRKRDLALAVLVNFHYFNLEQALPGMIPQKRAIYFEKKGSGEQFELLLFPGLTDQHFRAIDQYIRAEKWPITAEGIFYELRKNKNPELSLKEAFYKTPNFETFEILFKRNQLPFPREALLKVLLANDYLDLDQFFKKIVKDGTFSKDVLYDFLKKMTREQNAQAATWLIELDPIYLVKALEDQELLDLIKALKAKNEKIFSFLKEIVTSIRSDGIRKEAAYKLYMLYQDALPQENSQFDWMKALIKERKEDPKEIKNLKEHKVKVGDTLWQIARQYQIPLDLIVKWNNLDKTKPLQVGRNLFLEEKKTDKN